MIRVKYNLIIRQKFKSLKPSYKKNEDIQKLFKEAYVEIRHHEPTPTSSNVVSPNSGAGVSPKRGERQQDKKATKKGKDTAKNEQDKLITEINRIGSNSTLERDDSSTQGKRKFNKSRNATPESLNKEMHNKSVSSLSYKPDNYHNRISNGSLIDNADSDHINESQSQFM